jgi:hypothetical protein
MRYDLEFAASELFSKYLQNLCSTAVGQIMDSKACPIVTFYDPMSIDDADRLTVMSTSGDTDIYDRGRFTALIDVGLKTLWTQATIQADFKRHRERLNDVRDKLMPLDIITRLQPFLPDGMNVDFVQPKKQYETHVAESTQAKWIYSCTKFEVNGFFTASS